MIPVRNCRKYQLVHVGKDRAKIFAGFRSGLRNCILQRARFDLRQHRKLFDVLKIVRDPIDDLVTVLSKFVRRHVAEFVISEHIGDLNEGLNDLCEGGYYVRCHSGVAKT